jgi:hypothetical protein
LALRAKQQRDPGRNSDPAVNPPRDQLAGSDTQFSRPWLVRYRLYCSTLRTGFGNWIEARYDGPVVRLCKLHRWATRLGWRKVIMPVPATDSQPNAVPTPEISILFRVVGFIFLAVAIFAIIGAMNDRDTSAGLTGGACLILAFLLFVADAIITRLHRIELHLRSRQPESGGRWMTGPYEAYFLAVILVHGGYGTIDIKNGNKADVEAAIEVHSSDGSLIKSAMKIVARKSESTRAIRVLQAN